MLDKIYCSQKYIFHENFLVSLQYYYIQNFKLSGTKESLTQQHLPVAVMHEGAFTLRISSALVSTLDWKHLMVNTIISRSLHSKSYERASETKYCPLSMTGEDKFENKSSLLD